MKSECYVVNLIRRSHEARRYVEACLGWKNIGSTVQLIWRLFNHEGRKEAARTLRCVPLEIFSAIRAMLDRGITVNDPKNSQQVLPLTDEDLFLLLELDSRNVIAELLKCDVISALQALFDPDELRSLADDAKIHHFAEDDVSQLLSKLLANENRKSIHACLNTNLSRWNGLPSLLKKTAQSQLAKNLGCAPFDVLGVLITRIRGPVRGRTGSAPLRSELDGERFDAIGISKLLSLLEVIKEELLAFTSNAAERAAAHLRGFRRAELLYPILEFYARGRYRLALNELIRGKESLRQMTSNIEIMAEYPEAPENAQLQAISGPDPNTLVIQCCTESGKPPVDILFLRNLSRTVYDFIQKNLPKSVSELDKKSAVLAQRVLSTLFPVFSPIRAKLREAMETTFEAVEKRPIDPELVQRIREKAGDDVDEDLIKMIAEHRTPSQQYREIDLVIVQCLVLSGVDLKPTEVTHLDEIGIHFNFEPLSAGAATDRRIEFPLNASAIAQRFVQDYKNKGKRLKKIPIERLSANTS